MSYAENANQEPIRAELQEYLKSEYTESNYTESSGKEQEHSRYLSFFRTVVYGISNSFFITQREKPIYISGTPSHRWHSLVNQLASYQ